jgi:trimethylamine--corrinoid protein Co-methyltransferase
MIDSPNEDKKSPCPNFPRLTEGQARRMHEACLDILERVGVRLYLDEAVEMLKKAGARVTDGNLVRVPAPLVEKALETVPKRLTLYDRKGRPVMPLGGPRSFYGPGSDCLHIVDHRTGERRNPVVRDVEEGSVLCDFLPHIDYVMSMVLPSDVDGAVADRHQMEAMLSSTTKPIIFVTYDASGCRDAIEMAEAVMGGEEALRKTPLVACYVNAVSGLRHNREALEKLLFLASKNLPSLYIPSSTAAVTSPVTPAGSVALDFAGVLAGLVLSQLKREGAPVIIPGMPPGGTFDMRTFVISYAEPERTLTTALAHHYGIPMFAIGGASESKVVDGQAAAEAALTLAVETLAGSHIIHDLGYLESGLTFSFAQLVLCDEIVGWLKAFARGYDVSDEALALDVIAKLGPDGDFLNTDHTLNHFRERWYPVLFERLNYEAWQKKDGRPCAERAGGMIGKILDEHTPEPLPAPVRDKLRDIVRRARPDQAPD